MRSLPLRPGVAASRIVGYRQLTPGCKRLTPSERAPAACSQDVPEELLRPLVTGVDEHDVGAPGLDDLALIDEHHLVRAFACESRLVRDDDHRDPGLGQAADDREDLPHQLWVERGGRLV